MQLCSFLSSATPFQSTSNFAAESRSSVTVIMLIALWVLPPAIHFAALAASLWVFTDQDEGPYKVDGVGVTLGKCAGISVLVPVLLFVVPLVVQPKALPILAVLIGCLVAWLFLVRILFNTTWGQAFLIGWGAWFIEILIFVALYYLVGLSVLAAGSV
jgi:hypothetical protein